jgi:hypothetical protein
VRRLRALLIYAAGPDNATFSYQTAWPHHLARHARFECTAINLADRTLAARVARAWAVRYWRGDVVLLLHSVFSNNRVLDGHLFDRVAKLQPPKVWFIGNEYKFMPEKMLFAQELGIAMLVSQASDPAVHALYRERLGCAVAGMPNTGLDPEVFRPLTPYHERPIDLGYRAAPAPRYLGHRERQEIADYFTAHAAQLGLTVDISLHGHDRFAAPEWAAFLNRCKGQLGTEAGGDYFELDDRTRRAVLDYLAEHPAAPLEELQERFFNGRPQVPLRILSGRNVEAAGTGTVQLLFEGRYDGYFDPDEHYIPLKKDFSDVDEALRKFRDPATVARITDNARRLVLEQFTYDRLIDRLADTVQSLI